MADVVIGGSAPPADTSKYPPGTVWMDVRRMGIDVSGKTFRVRVWSTQMPSYIGWNKGGPGYDMQGGPFPNTIVPAAWTTPPTGGAPGLYETGDLIIVDPFFYHIETMVSGVRKHVDCQLGTPGVAQMGRDIDLEAAQKKTPWGRIEEERRKARDMMRPTGIIGTPKRSRQRMPPRVPRV
jgi:hypothetical protein